MLNSKAVACEKLFNMMKISEKISPDYSSACKLVCDRNVANRSYAIEWIKKILSKEVRGSVEISIQIFDQFVLASYAKDASVLADTSFLSYSAACAAILGVKMLDTKTQLNMVSFSSFNTERLLSFECKMLKEVLGKVYPLCSPASFVQHIVSFCPPSHKVLTLLNTVDQLINEFDEDHEYVLYSPSTIAISALLISFSLHHINCTEWLESIPDFCLPNENNPFYGSHGAAGWLPLDIDRCILSFEKIPMLRQSCSKSPTGIADLC